MPDTGITDEMIEQAAMELARQDGVDWSVISASPQGYYCGVAEDVLNAALAGRTVVVSPDPDGTDSEFVVTGLACSFGPRVNVRGGPLLTPEAAEKRATALLDAAREARRLAAEARALAGCTAWIAECDGSGKCPSGTHNHGCFAESSGEGESRG